MIDAYNDNLYVRRRDGGHFAPRRFHEIDDHEHSVRVEDCFDYGVVVCHDGRHTKVKMIACCTDEAERSAKEYFRRNLHIFIEIAEVWGFIPEHGPEVSYLHEDCVS